MKPQDAELAMTFMNKPKLSGPVMEEFLRNWKTGVVATSPRAAILNYITGLGQMNMDGGVSAPMLPVRSIQGWMDVARGEKSPVYRGLQKAGEASWGGDTSSARQYLADLIESTGRGEAPAQPSRLTNQLELLTGIPRTVYGNMDVAAKAGVVRHQMSPSLLNRLTMGKLGRSAKSMDDAIAVASKNLYNPQRIPEALKMARANAFAVPFGTFGYKSIVSMLDLLRRNPRAIQKMLNIPVAGINKATAGNDISMRQQLIDKPNQDWRDQRTKGTVAGQLFKDGTMRGLYRAATEGSAKASAAITRDFPRIILGKNAMGGIDTAAATPMTAVGGALSSRGTFLSGAGGPLMTAVESSQRVQEALQKMNRAILEQTEKPLKRFEDERRKKTFSNTDVTTAKALLSMGAPAIPPALRLLGLSGAANVAGALAPLVASPIWPAMHRVTAAHLAEKGTDEQKKYRAYAYPGDVSPNPLEKRNINFNIGSGYDKGDILRRILFEAVSGTDPERSKLNEILDRVSTMQEVIGEPTGTLKRTGAYGLRLPRLKLR
jgi:hypothetical protein